MFKTNPKIKQVTACSSGDFLFVFGLGKDGLMYIWNSLDCAWKPHQQVPQQTDPAAAPIPPAAPNRAARRRK